MFWNIKIFIDVYLILRILTSDWLKLETLNWISPQKMSTVEPHYKEVGYDKILLCVFDLLVNVCVCVSVCLFVCVSVHVFASLHLHW